MSKKEVIEGLQKKLSDLLKEREKNHLPPIVRIDYMQEAVRDIASTLLKDIEHKKVDILEMFCQQGPPTKHWIKTKGQFWEGWNEACNQIIPMVREKLLVGSSPTEAKE